MKKKKKLLEAMAETRQREAELVGLCSEAPPDASGRWLPKDHLAHLSDGREREAQLIDAVRTGAEPPPETEEGHNDAFYRANREQPVAEVIAGASRSWDHVLAAVAACTDEDLERPRPHEKDRKLVDGSPGDHLAAHIFWCQLEAGDVKAAEAILLWARDLSARTIDDPRVRAVGTYNLACFYARTGKPKEALPLLRESFEAAPYLKEWSLKDPDLDQIRDDPQIAQLLTGTPSERVLN